MTEKQIAFIRDDLKARGIGMDSLRDDLIDHICCMAEQELGEESDFDSFYQRIIGTFYRSEICEIEKETIYLLTHKNFYIMKKIMLLSGLASTVLLIFGLLFKFQHWPGASLCLFSGIFCLSFIFLPLVLALKMREDQSPRDKMLIVIATIAAGLISVGIMFKMMHWPGANVVCLSALGLMALVFLPLHFLNGVRNPDKKINTMVSPILILSGCAMLLVLVRSPRASHEMFVVNTGNVLRSEQMICYERRLNPVKLNGQAEEIFALCDEIKKFLINTETGSDFIDNDFENRGQLLTDTQAEDYLRRSQKMQQNLALLTDKVQEYNKTLALGQQPIRTKLSLSAFPQRPITQALTDLMQFQMLVLQNSRLRT